MHLGPRKKSSCPERPASDRTLTAPRNRHVTLPSQLREVSPPSSRRVPIIPAFRANEIKRAVFESNRERAGFLRGTDRASPALYLTCTGPRRGRAPPVRLLGPFPIALRRVRDDRTRFAPKYRYQGSPVGCILASAMDEIKLTEEISASQVQSGMRENPVRTRWRRGRD